MYNKKLKSTMGGIDDHDVGIEEVIFSGQHLKEVKEEVEVKEDGDAGIDEDDLVVIVEFP